MHFGFRIIRKDLEYEVDGNSTINSFYYLADVRYDSDGLIFSFSPFGEENYGSVSELIFHHLDCLIEALSLPILNEDDLPEEGSVDELTEIIKNVEEGKEETNSFTTIKDMFLNDFGYTEEEYEKQKKEFKERELEEQENEEINHQIHFLGNEPEEIAKMIKDVWKKIKTRFDNNEF